ncbi:MAG: sigma-70 family RNA polymerase sigma factor [Planctomycetaceae bacterium]
MTDRQTASEDARSPDGEFVQCFTRYQRRLYLYILAQVPNPHEAEEILQETNLVVWRKCEQFQLGTNFLAWSSRIASYEVLKYRERRRRDKLRFSEKFLEAVSREVLEDEGRLEERRKALHVCLGKLRETDRELIRRRYASGQNGKVVAETLGRPANSVYQSLGRIRRTLLECMQRRLATETGQ